MGFLKKLAACGDDSPAAIPQNSGSPGVSKDSGGAVNDKAAVLNDQTAKKA